MIRSQTLTLLPLVVAAACLGSAITGSLATRARAQEGDGAAAAVKPAPFEYRVFLLDYTEYSEKDEWKAFLAHDGGNALKADADFRSYVINYLAHDGWEVVQLVQLKEKLSYLYLKRPRTSDALPTLPDATPDAPSDPKNYPNPDPRTPHKPH